MTISTGRLRVVLAAGLAATFSPAWTAAAEPLASVGVWERWERTFTSKADPETDFLVEFSGPPRLPRRVRGFWDGGTTWRVRFMPDQPGEWRYRTRSQPPSAGLEGVAGSFRCIRTAAPDRFRKHGAVRVAANGHHFEHADGTPFFWLVDTAWNGALKSTREDWERYLENRAAKGFTGVQFVVTQWRTAYTNAEGQIAYSGYDKIRIHPEFFRRIDERLAQVNAKGLLAVPVLLWTLGQRQHNPGQLPESQAIRLARYMTARYDASHVVYFLPGDGNYFGDNGERWKRIGRAVFDSQPHPPVFLHPQGMQWPYDAFVSEKWLSAFGYQSGHGDDDRTLAWLHSGPPAQKWNRRPYRPVINLEPPYEDHIAYQSRQRHTDDTVRRALYWSLLNAPTAGTSYGAHGVWSWESSAQEPQEHGGTGVARPWFEAMDLPGSSQIKHLCELFTSLRWWDLRPANDLVEPESGRARGPKLTYVAYTRDQEGDARLYRDGQLESRMRVRGGCTNWSADFRLALANELTGDRPWRGELRRVAIYDRELGESEIAAHFEKSYTGKPASGVRVLYTFEEAKGDRIYDRARSDGSTHLRIRDAAAVSWIPGGGILVHRPVLISSEEPPSGLVAAVKDSGALTIEAWFKPADLVQSGPARIVTLSRDTGQRNFTLGQTGSGYEVRFRTTKTSLNGEPAVSTKGGGEAARRIAAACSEAGDLAVVYLPQGGAVRVNASRLKGDWRARWFDPRTGRYQGAKSDARSRFFSPGGGDWVLVITAAR